MNIVKIYILETKIVKKLNPRNKNCQNRGRKSHRRRQATLLRRRVALGGVAVADGVHELVLHETQALAFTRFES